MKNSIRRIVLPLFVLLAGLLAVQGMGWMGKPDAADDRQFSQKVNLAMRQAADRMFDLAGDSTSTIPPVEEFSSSEYLLRLENNINYDSLPILLEAALGQYGIHEKYYVSVNDCLNNLLMLGYSQETLKEGEPPCGGREQKIGCYNLSVVFPGRAKKEAGNGWVWAALLALAGLTFAAPYFNKVLKNKPLPADEPIEEATRSCTPEIPASIGRTNTFKSATYASRSLSGKPSCSIFSFKIPTKYWSGTPSSPPSGRTRASSWAAAWTCSSPACARFYRKTQPSRFPMYIVWGIGWRFRENQSARAKVN